MAVVAAAGKVVAGERRLGPQGALAAPGRPQPRSTRALSWQSRAGAARVAVAAASFGSAAEAAPFVATGVDWTVEVTRHTLTMPQVLEHLQLLERMEAAAATSASQKPSTGGGAAKPAASASHRVSWVQHSTSATAGLMDGLLSGDSGDAGSEGDRLMAAVAALPPHLLTESQQAAVILQAWESAAHAKPPGFDAAAQLTLPGLAEVAVVSRGGWQRHSWKGVNQDSFLALPLAAGAACGSGNSSDGDSASAPAACASSAVAIGVFDGHGRAGEAASAHLRNALASGMLMHSQLALMAQPAECQQQQEQDASQPQQQAGTPAPAAAAASSAHISRAPEDAAQEEAAALLERCFAAAASTMPSTGSDFSLSGSTAVMCLVQPGSVTAAWAGDSRAVLGLQEGDRYIACALTSDHKPSSPLERSRIERAGGWVMQSLLDEGGRPAGPHRVYLRESNIPGLAVSRCFGDYVATAAGVTSTPDIVTLVLPTSSSSNASISSASSSNAGTSSGGSSARADERGSQRGSNGSRNRSRSNSRGRRPAHKHHRQQRKGQQQARPDGAGSSSTTATTATTAGRRHILIVASDGLWEFVGNAEAVRIASRCATAQAAAECLVLEAQAQWAVRFGGAHCDDITVACAFLPIAA